MYTLGEKIVPRDIEQELKDSYLSYAMSVIVGRALPDVRDGLKPVHRRILYAMRELGLDRSKPYKKCARIVGEVLGKYHPHGDTAVYDSLVRMVQTFSLRYPLVDGQGNFGSIDGDAAAAMRYTEARMDAIAGELLTDIEKNTVDMGPNFDGSLLEPRILPARIPNLLVNGSSGIAVGMATNIPPHNLTEVINATCALIDDPGMDVAKLMKYVTGPDFPTAGIICGRDGIKKAYETGRGSLKIRSKVHTEALKGNRQSIVVTELPYQVNKANLLENIARLVHNKQIEGISDLRDESDKDGLRVVIELKRDANDQVVLNLLYKHTQMATSFGIIFLALVDGRPRVLGLRPLLKNFIEHRKDIIIRRTKFDLAKAEARAHILEGLKKALDHLDEIIKTIRASKTPSAAKESLVKKFKFSDRQAQAILEMQLQRLTALERDKLEAEYLELLKRIEYFKSLLASESLLLGVIKEELQEVNKKYGDERRTEIIGDVSDLSIEDLIVDENVVITVSHSGYIKRLPVSAYRKQRRGGVGVTAVNMKEEDFVEYLFVASTHDTLMFFTNLGRCYWLKAYDVPQAGRYARGTAIVNLLSFQKDEHLSTVIPVKNFDVDKGLLMATKKGVVKKSKLSAYANPRKTGIIAITIDQGDELIQAAVTNGDEQIILCTRQGKSIRFLETQVRETGRSSRGVRGIALAPTDAVIGMALVCEGKDILTITEKGFGKRSSFDEYRAQSRGGKGVINIRVTPKNGEVIGARTVSPEDEVMLISSEGMMVRTPVKDVRRTGRGTQGVKAINIKGKDKVASMACVVPEEKDDEILPEADESQPELDLKATKDQVDPSLEEEKVTKTSSTKKAAKKAATKKNKTKRKK